MDFPRKHGRFVNYSMPKDHNIFDLDRSYINNENKSANKTSERNIDHLQQVTSLYPYYLIFLN